MGREKNNAIITGAGAAWIKTRTGLALVRIAFQTFRNPVRSLRALRLLIQQRARLHGNKKDHKIVRSGNRYFWSIYTPGFPSDQFNAIIKREILRAFPSSANGSGIPLQTLILGLSSRCNYHCEHCFEAERLDEKEHLTREDLISVMEDAVSNGVRHLQFGGGEPMLRFDDMLQVMNQARGTMDFWISTSGFGFTRERAHELRKAGMTGAAISLDHWDKTSHDRFRGFPGAFELAMDAVRHCHDAGIIPNLTLCVTREMANEENLLTYLDLAREMRVPFVRFLEPRKAGNYAGKNILLRENEQRNVLHFYLKMNSQRSYRSYPIIQYPGYHQRKLGCFGAGNRYLYVNSRGEYQGCPFCDGSVGNIRDMNLQSAISLLQSKGCNLFRTNHEV
jgi:MoaA/NifB/PqqE/SkfB family radical SAM enzyme